MTRRRVPAPPRSVTDLLAPVFRTTPRQRRCRTCHAAPGEPCVLVRGRYAGTYAQSSHRAR